VLQAAVKLGITVPPEIVQANAIFGMGVSQSLDQLPPSWPDMLKSWSQTPDYARACIAAFEAR